MIVGDGGGAIVLFLSGCCQCNRHDLERNSMEFPQQAEIGHSLVECLEHIPLMGLWTSQLWVQWNQFPTPVFAQGGEKKGLSDLEQHGAGRISEFEISSTTSERSCWWKMFAGYVYMYTLSQYWLPQCILDVVSSVFSVVPNWGEHWVYALACSLLHVRWLPLESDDQKSSARWCKVCSYVLPFFCTSLVVRCVRAIGNCCIARLFFFRSTFMMFLMSAAPFAVARFLDTQARTSHRQDEFYLGAQFTAEALSCPAMHAQGVHGGSISLW